MKSKLLSRNLRNRLSWHSNNLRMWISLRDSNAGYITIPAYGPTRIYSGE